MAVNALPPVATPAPRAVEEVLRAPAIAHVPYFRSPMAASRATGTSRLERLPVELQTAIFRHLGVSEMAAVSATSRALYQAVEPDLRTLGRLHEAQRREVLNACNETLSSADRLAARGDPGHADVLRSVARDPRQVRLDARARYDQAGSLPRQRDEVVARLQPVTGRDEARADGGRATAPAERAA